MTPEKDPFAPKNQYIEIAASAAANGKYSITPFNLPPKAIPRFLSNYLSVYGSVSHKSKRSSRKTLLKARIEYDVENDMFFSYPVKCEAEVVGLARKAMGNWKLQKNLEGTLNE